MSGSRTRMLPSLCALSPVVLLHFVLQQHKFGLCQPRADDNNAPSGRRSLNLAPATTWRCPVIFSLYLVMSEFTFALPSARPRARATIKNQGEKVDTRQVALNTNSTQITLFLVLKTNKNTSGRGPATVPLSGNTGPFIVGFFCLSD